MLWNVQEQEQTSSCFWRDFSDAILLFGRKTSVVEDFSEIEKIKLCLCPDISTDSRWSTLIVKSKGSKGGNWPGIKDYSNSSRWIWFNFTKKTLLEKLFLTLDFLEFMNRQLSRRRIRLRLCSHCLKYHRGRVEMISSVEGHFDSQIKESSDSFRRRHSSEGVDAKFSSTLPKDWILTGKTMDV